MTRRRHLDLSSLPALGFVVVLIVIGASSSDRFLTVFNVSNVLTQITPLLLVAVGQTFVIATAGIDLSTGSVVSLVSAVSATLFASAGIPVTVVVSLVIAAVVGAVNGLLVDRGLEPFLVTLATLSVVQGVAFIVLPSPGGRVPDAFGNLAGYFPGGLVPYALPLALLVLVAGTVLMRFTRLGLDVRALGSSAEVAGLCGVASRRTLLWAYGVCGLLGGVAGLFADARTLAGDPLAGATFTLDAIAAVVLGGTAVTGGRASVLGSALGAVALGLISNVLNFAHLQTFYQQAVKGVVVVLAVGLPLVVVRAVRAARARRQGADLLRAHRATVAGGAS